MFGILYDEPSERIDCFRLPQARTPAALPWLVPTAAACLTMLMVSAAVFHLRRPGAAQNITVNAALGVLALAVAIGRFVISPF